MCAEVLREGSFCIGDHGGPLVTKTNMVSKQLYLCCLEYILHSTLRYGIFHSMYKTCLVYYTDMENIHVSVHSGRVLNDYVFRITMELLP